MLSFLWHLRGSVLLDGATTDAAAIAAIARMLEEQRKPLIEQEPDHLAFVDPIWNGPLAPNWLALVIYDRGRFWIDREPRERRLRYELRSLHGMVFCLFAALAFFIFGIAEGSVLDGLNFAAFAFAWLYGVNVLLARARVPSLIRRTLRAA